MSVSAAGEYSCLRTKLILQREYSYYLIQLYIPSFMLVVVSWVSFWLDKDAVPARVSLGVTTLLTMTTQASGINAKLPPVSYTKAVDVWIGVCLAFIFGALLEFALVNYAGRMEFLEKEKKAKRRKQDPQLSLMNQNLSSLPEAPSTAVPGMTDLLPPSFQPIPSHGMIGPAVTSGIPSEIPCPQCEAEHDHRANMVLHPLVPPSPLEMRNSARLYKTGSGGGTRRPVLRVCRICCGFGKKYKERSKRIDVISRIVFPLGFFFFNCVYWVAYMI